MSNCLSEKCNNCPIGFICSPMIIPNGIKCKQFGKLWKKTLLQGGHSTALGTGNTAMPKFSCKVCGNKDTRLLVSAWCLKCTSDIDVSEEVIISSKTSA